MPILPPHSPAAALSAAAVGWGGAGAHLYRLLAEAQNAEERVGGGMTKLQCVRSLQHSSLPHRAVPGIQSCPEMGPAAGSERRGGAELEA